MKYFPGSKTDMVAMETRQWNKFVQNLRRYRCEICGLQCRNKSGLKTHLRVHTGEKPFRCSLCGRGFARGYDMKIHVNSCKKKSTWVPRKMINIVHGVRRYRCEICGLQCRNKSGLQTHLRVHTGEKPFRCSLCGRGFARGYDMKIHVNSCRKKSAWGPRKMSNIVLGVRRYRCVIHGWKFSGLILSSGF